MNQNFFILAWLLAFAPILACSPRISSPPTDTLVVGLASAPATVNPLRASDATSSRLVALVTSGFVKLNNALELEPDAAVRWTQSGRKISLWVRQDLVFHDGTPVKKEDLEYSFQAYQSSASAFASTFSEVVHVQVKWRAPFWLVEIKLRQPSAKFLSSDLRTIRLLRKNPSSSLTDPIDGTGPWRMLSVSDAEIALRATSTHNDGRPRLKNLIFRVIRDDETRLQLLVRGELDAILGDFSPRQFARLKAQSPDLNLLAWPGLSTTYLMPNWRDSLLQNPKVREALALTLDRKSLVKYKLEGLSDEAATLITPRVPFFAADVRNSIPDPDRSQKIIHGLGLDGKSLTVTVANSKSAVDMAQALRLQLQQSGLNIEVQPLEWGRFYRDLQRGNFQLALSRWVGAVDADLYRVALHSRELPPGRNRGAYSNQDVDRWLDLAIHALNPDKRRDYYWRVQHRVQEDQALWPLWHDYQLAAFAKSVKGFTPSPSGDFSGLAGVWKDPSP